MGAEIAKKLRAAQPQPKVTSSYKKETCSRFLKVPPPAAATVTTCIEQVVYGISPELYFPDVDGQPQRYIRFFFHFYDRTKAYFCFYPVRKLQVI